MLGFINRNLKLRGKIMLIVVLVLFVSIGVVGWYSISQIIKKAETDIAVYEREEMEKVRAKLKDLVLTAYAAMENAYNQSVSLEGIIDNYDESLKSLVDIPYSLIEQEYNEAVKGNQAMEEAKRKAMEAIRAARYAKAGYFFINDTDVKMIMHPISPSLEGKDVSSLEKDGKVIMAEGTQTPMVKAMVDVCLASPTADGFVSYFWPHPVNTEIWVRKLSYVRLFKPWNWVVGTGIYVDQVEVEARETAKSTIGSMRYGTDGYFWINDTHPNMVMHPIVPALNGEDLSAYEKDGKVVMADGTQTPMFKEMANVCLASQNGEGFVGYQWPHPSDKTRWAPKLSYVKLFKPWNWIVGTGVYLDAIEAAVDARKEEMRRTITNQVIFISAAALTILALSLLFAFLMSRNFIEKPIKKAVSFAGAVKAGDLTRRLKAPESKDEISRLSDALDSMADSLKEKADLAESIAEGDLTPDVHLASKKDALGKSLSIMVANLNEVMSEVREAVNQVASGSDQVSQSSQSLAEGASKQAAALQEITSAMTELGSQTRSNAESASQAYQLANDAKTEAEEGDRQMREMTGAMSEINESSKEIAKIIKTIDDIAFQTNLLALNAAVEAARAGKHGKGFAVVAQEVRNLAGRSATAANETTELIQNSVKRIENGAAIVARTAESLSGIVDIVIKVAGLIGEISHASNEQAQGIAQVDQGLNQIDQVTQQNTANSEQTAAAAEELSSQAAQVRNLLARFRLKTKKGPSGPSPEGFIEKHERSYHPAPMTEASWGAPKGDKKAGMLDDIDFTDNDFEDY